MLSFFHPSSPLKRLSASTLLAVLLSSLCFAILFLEYGVLNFGDSDLPPYQPDTFFEKTLNCIWYAVTLGAALMWLFAIVYAIVLLCRQFNRRLA